MKKAICLAVTLVMLAAAAIPARAEKGENAVDRMLDQVAVFFDAQEQIGTRLRASYQKAGAFFERGDYASLTQARLACSEALENLRGFELPRLALSEAEMLSLMQLNVEAIGLEDKESELQSTLQTAMDRLAALEGFLYSASIHAANGRKTGTWLAGSMEGALSQESSFSCLWLNDLLLPLAGDDRISAFWNSLPARWPMIAEQRQEWISDPALLMDRGVAVLEEMEKTLDEISAAYGRNDFDLQRYAQDSKAFAEDFMQVTGMPETVPLPDFWYASGGRSLHAGSDDPGGEELPGTLIWHIPDVFSDRFLAYADQLAEAGFEKTVTGSAQEGWKATMTAGGKVLLMVWQTNGDVMIAYDPKGLTLEDRRISAGG